MQTQTKPRSHGKDRRCLYRPPRNRLHRRRCRADEDEPMDDVEAAWVAATVLGKDTVDGVAVARAGGKVDTGVGGPTMRLCHNSACIPCRRQ